MDYLQICMCRECRNDRNQERLNAARLKTSRVYALTPEDEEKLATVAVSLPTFGVVKGLVALCFSLSLMGCYDPMSNEQIIQEVNKCKAAELDFKIVSGDFGPVRVECTSP